MELKRDTLTDSSLLTYVEAAQYLRIAGRTLQKMNIPCAKLGKVIYYRKRDLDNLQEFLEFKPLKEWKEAVDE